MAIVNITSDNFEAEILKSKIPVIIDFWASWCPPCRMMCPIFEELADDKAYAGRLKFAKLDTEEAPEIAGKYEVMNIPSFIIFKNGAEAARIVGGMPKEDFKKQVDAAMMK